MVSLRAILVGVASTLASVRAFSSFESEWMSLYTEAGQVSYDGKTLCTSSGFGGGILCATEGLDESPRWRYIAGDVKWISVWGDHLWTVNSLDQIVLGSSTGDANWRVIPGSLKQITADGKQVCGVNGNKELFCADDAITTNPNWRQLPGSFEQVDLTDGILYATAPDGVIMWGYSDGEPNWNTISIPRGGLKQLAFDGSMLCGVSGNNDLFCADDGLRTNPNWRQIEGQFIEVEVEAGRVYAVGLNTVIYLRWFTPPPVEMKGWTKLKTLPKLRQLNYDGRTLCGTATDEGIWCATGGFEDGEPNWQQLDGGLSHVVVWGDSIYGVNSLGNVWTANSRGPTQWRLLPGDYKQLSTDGKQLCAVDRDHLVWCADSLIDTMPNWQGPKGTFQHIQVLNGVLFGTSPVDNLVWMGRSYGEPKWSQLQGNLRNLDYDGVNLCGTGPDGTIMCADGGFNGPSPNWRVFEGKGAYATVNSGRIFALDSQFGVYMRSDL
ncbi:hypothetical protein PybrP1_001029 [[Pythium] brassicae (nom. inval.)]|nr:hypothetical protein PybrP1_001029 [[Pythium] brassicae (nom. inval.)]